MTVLMRRVGSAPVSENSRSIFNACFTYVTKCKLVPDWTELTWHYDQNQSVKKKQGSLRHTFLCIVFVLFCFPCCADIKSSTYLLEVSTF